jgi:hypothetical protein
MNLDTLRIQKFTLAHTTERSFAVSDRSNLPENPRVLPRPAAGRTGIRLALCRFHRRRTSEKIIRITRGPMYHAQLTRYLSKFDRRPEATIAQRQRGGRRGSMSASSTREKYRVNPWRVLAYQAVCFSFLAFLSVTWLRPSSTQEVPDWKPVLALAEVAAEKNELYVANGLYAQAGRLAARREDWVGLLSAACGMKRLERERGPYSTTSRLLVRAMVAAEAKQSTAGMTAVANAFTALGKHRMAAHVLARVQPRWPAEKINSGPPDCWRSEQSELAAAR